MILPMKLSIRLTVLSAFVLATVMIVTIAISLQYYFSRKMATESALFLTSGVCMAYARRHLKFLP
jgi:hypothetical protein